MKDNNKEVSVIEQAVIQLQTIVEAADKSAKDKMAKQLPEQFEKLLKEEINKNKKESVQESVKDVTKEPVNKGRKTDGDKESLNEMEEIDLSELSLNDIEDAYNGADELEEFEVFPDEIDLGSVEKELGEMQDMTADVDIMQQEGDNPNDPFDKIKNLHKMLGEMIQDNEMTNEMKNNGGPDSGNIDQMQGGKITPSLIDEGGLDDENMNMLEKFYDEVKSGTFDDQGKVSIISPDLVHRANSYEEFLSMLGVLPERLGIDRPPAPEVDDSLELEETAGSDGGIASNRTTGRMPKNDSFKKRGRFAVREGHNSNIKSKSKWSNESVEKFITQKGNMEKRMTSLIKENKNVTKKLNESKTEAKKFAKVSSDQKVLKEALVKYRDQLSEMAVFNTNLASVNNILVNEDLALTADDKKQLITKFKNVKTVDESEQTYKSVLAEMVAVKKPIVESIEEKVSDAIEPSAKVNEQTAYVNEHIDKIKKTMKYVDGHGNSRILS